MIQVTRPAKVTFVVWMAGAAVLVLSTGGDPVRSLSGHLIYALLAATVVNVVAKLLG
jgi:hypothetical protein